MVLGTREVLEEAPDRVKESAGASTSATVKGIKGVGVSSSVTLSVMSEIVGGSGTGLTVKTKESLAKSPSPSVTVTVMVVEPN